MSEYICPECEVKRVQPFPVSDESGDTYCPDCNHTFEDDEVERAIASMESTRDNEIKE